MAEKPFYTGVGSHFGTPPDIQRDMIIIAIALEEMGYICRTGDAPECDAAFRRGVRHKENIEVYERGNGTQASIELMLKLHPNKDAAKKYVRWLGRNPMQVAGENLDKPSKFLICWTPGGEVVGGTGLTIRVAKHFKVPVLNLFEWSKEDVIDVARNVKEKPFYEIPYKNIREIVGDFGGLLP